MAEWAQKRFWKEVTVVADDGGWRVELDGRSVKTPAKNVLMAPTNGLAQAVADEWDAQEEQVDPRAMLFTRAVNVAIDKVSHAKPEVTKMLAEYGASDLLCYRADAPDGLVARQNAAWNPLLDWAEATYGAALATTAGVMPITQEPGALAHLSAPLDKLDAFELTAIHEFITISGSLVIGLATFNEAFPLDDLWAAARIDETWQMETWGVDSEAAQVSENKRQSFFQSAEFLRLLRGT